MHDYADNPIVTCHTGPMSRREFLLTLASLKAVIPLTMTAAVIVAMIILGLAYDLRYIIISLMLIALVLPMLAFFLYFFYALSPRCLHCVHPHTVTVYPNGLRISYEIPSISADNEQDDPPRIICEQWSRDEIASFKIRIHSLIIISRSPFGFVKLPYEQTSDPETAIKWLNGEPLTADDVKKI